MRRFVRTAAAVAGLALISSVSYVAWRAVGDRSELSEGAVQEVSISASAWTGLEGCALSPALFEIQNKLLATASPLRKEEGAWIYRVSGEFLGLKVREMEVGVCDSTGSRACGWGSYVGLIVELPFSEVRQILQTRFGIDYTEELRDNDVLMTDRPVLSEDKPGRSRLHCDPGAL